MNIEISMRVVILALLICAGIEANAACDGPPTYKQLYADGWGIDSHNSRLQPQTSINADNVDTLSLKWAYGYSNTQPRSWPLVTENAIIIGDTGKGVVALDRETGCTRWLKPHAGQIASAILYAGRIDDKDVLVFADRTEGIYAIDGSTGDTIWHSAVKDEPVPYYSGTPVIQAGKVFVPISSLEIGLTANPLYGCCTTSGGMAALDLATGKQLWYLPTIQEEAKLTHRHYFLVKNLGPSGAPVWGSATFSEARDTLYYGSGQNYSRPASLTSDAIFAVNASDGSIKWVRQFTEGDAYNIACDISLNHPNCPKPMGPDYDFGAPPVLVSSGDRELVIAGQKSGDIHAMDPDTGEVLWEKRIGRGGALGGIHWGIAADERRGVVYIPVSDIQTHPVKREPAPGLYALDIATGEIRWSTGRAARCSDRQCAGGLSAAITATPDLIVAGSLDGFIEIYNAEDGSVLWSDDTWKSYSAVNGIETSGGAFDAHGPMLADNLLIISSGYGSFGQKGGNALLVFAAEEAQP